MIKINFTPPEELENPLWFVPDVLLAVLFCVIGYFGVNVYLEGERARIAGVAEETTIVEVEARKFQEFVSRLESLKKDVTSIKSRFSKLRGVSGSLVSKYAPVIAIEHIQNLKPNGMWLTQLDVGSKNFTDTTVSVKAYALDNLLVAEFMASLKATAAQDVEASDMRTQIYMDEIELDRTTRTGVPGDAIVRLGNQSADASQRRQRVVSFTLKMKYKENTALGVRPIVSFDDFYPVNTAFSVARK